MIDDEGVRAIFAAVDSCDPDAIAAHFADDIHLVIGSSAPVEGRQDASEAFATVGRTFSSVRHAISGIWRGRSEAQGRTADVASVEAAVTYTLPDGRSVTVPCTSTLRLAEDGRIRDYRIFMDAAPVQAALGAAEPASAKRASNEQTVRDFLRFLAAEDIEAWAELFAEDGVQENPYAPPGFPKRFDGRAAIKAHYATLPGTFDYMRYPDLVVRQTLDPDEVVAEFRGDIKLKGADRKYDNRYCCIFRFDMAGKIKTYREYFDPLVLTEAFADHDGPRMHALAPSG